MDKRQIRKVHENFACLGCFGRNIEMVEGDKIDFYSMQCLYCGKDAGMHSNMDAAIFQWMMENSTEDVRRKITCDGNVLHNHINKIRNTKPKDRNLVVEETLEKGYAVTNRTDYITFMAEGEIRKGDPVFINRKWRFPNPVVEDALGND